MTEQDAINMLQAKATELNRLPKKSDFLPVEVSRIKAKLGPWNRALEKAQLKEISVLYLQKKERIKNKRIIKRSKNE